MDDVRRLDTIVFEKWAGQVNHIPKHICWTVAILFLFGYVEANTGCSISGAGFPICFSGFPARMLLLSDAGGLRPFDWTVWSANAAVGVFGLLLLVWRCWGNDRVRWMQFSSGALFTAAFAWANPILFRLKAAEHQEDPGFVRPTFVDAGFPFRFLSAAKGVQPLYALLNVLFALVCLAAIYRFFEVMQHENRAKPHALKQWAAIMVSLVGYVWVIEQYGRVSALWHGFGFAYFVTDDGLARLRWWVAGTDVLVGVLLITLLLFITTSERANVILFIGAFTWANLASWPRWYDWLKAGGGYRFQIGFPFPSYWRWSNSTDLIYRDGFFVFGALITNMAIGLGSAYLIHRRSRRSRMPA